MRKPILLISAAALLATLSSCTYQTTFLVQEPKSGIPMYARYSHVRKDGRPSDQQVEAMTRQMTRGLTPEQLGKEYFPDQGAGGNATVTVAPSTRTVPARRGLPQACYVANVTVRAKSSRMEFQEALNRINADFYKRASSAATTAVIRIEDVPVAVGRKL